MKSCLSTLTYHALSAVLRPAMNHERGPGAKKYAHLVSFKSSQRPQAHVSISSGSDGAHVQHHRVSPEHFLSSLFPVHPSGDQMGGRLPRDV